MAAWLQITRADGTKDSYQMVVLADAAGAPIQQAAVSPSGSSKVEPLGLPSKQVQLAATDTNASASITTGITRCSMIAIGCAIRFNINAASTITSYYIADGERIDIALPTGAKTIQARRIGAVSGVLEITELA